MQENKWGTFSTFSPFFITATCKLYIELEVYMGIWTPRAKPEESKFTYTPTTRCITDLNYVLTMQGHWDCATHRVAETDHHVACRLQRFPLVDKDQNGLRRRR